MASLFDKLVGNEEPRVSVHGFVAALKEWQDGAVTRADIVQSFGLDAGDESDLDWLKAQAQASADREKFVAALEQVLILGQQRRFGYNVKATAVARVSALAS